MYGVVVSYCVWQLLALVSADCNNYRIHLYSVTLIYRLPAFFFAKRRFEPESS